tara:strand:- start:825 stop:1016 length:192 start_codon:yes stop_codon:yes gene_type:complete
MLQSFSEQSPGFCPYTMLPDPWGVSNQAWYNLLENCIGLLGGLSAMPHVDDMSQSNVPPLVTL